jgi:hypothetical protein
MESGYHYEFYNAGDRIRESMRFSISESSVGFNSEEKPGGCLGYWTLDAGKEDFFLVPAEIQSGMEVLRVNFADDIKRKLGKRGVVLVDPKWKPENEDPEKEVSEYPIAPDKNAAVARAEEIWKLHLRRVVESHLADCQNSMAAGGAPRAAAGFTKKAFKLLGVADPGEQYFHGLKEAGKAAGNNQGNDVLLALQQQNQAMMAIILAVATGQKVDPELLKALAPQPGKTPIAQVVSGIATGEIKKPVGDFDPTKAGLDGKAVEVKPGQVGLEAYDRHTKPKADRAKNAAKDLAT